MKKTMEYQARDQHRKYGERDSGLTEEEICNRLRSAAKEYLESQDLLERAAECIERLVGFRAAVRQQRVELDRKIIQQGDEIERMRVVIDTYARVTAASSDELRMLRIKAGRL